jgi:hypothetical protein
MCSLSGNERVDNLAGMALGVFNEHLLVMVNMSDA